MGVLKMVGDGGILVSPGRAGGIQRGACPQPLGWPYIRGSWPGHVLGNYQGNEKAPGPGPQQHLPLRPRFSESPTWPQPGLGWKHEHIQQWQPRLTKPRRSWGLGKGIPSLLTDPQILLCGSAQYLINNYSTPVHSPEIPWLSLEKATQDPGEG